MAAKAPRAEFFGHKLLQIKVAFTGGDQMGKRLSAIKAATGEEIRLVLVRGALAGRNEALSKAAVDTGLLRARIAYFFPQGPKVPTVTLRSGSSYSAFVEYGTGPRGAGSNRQELPRGYRHGGAYYPPVAAIEGWARRHGLNPYAVVQGIHKSGGTKAQPFFGPGQAKAATVMRNGFGDVLRKAARRAK